jgi:hypothetical protein
MSGASQRGRFGERSLVEQQLHQTNSEFLLIRFATEGIITETRGTA